MRYAASLLFIVSISGCGGHRPAMRTALAEAGTPCEEFKIDHDPNDIQLLHARGCDRDVLCWFGRPSGKMRCGPTRPDELRDVQAREALRCPDGKLESGGDAPDWRTTIVGCDRVTWCSEDKADKLSCTPPHDLSLAVKQLSVETGCPSESIEQMQFFGTNLQNTYRLNACGSQFSCVVPLVQQGGDRVAGSRFGSQLTCKPVAATAVAP